MGKGKGATFNWARFSNSPEGDLVKQTPFCFPTSPLIPATWNITQPEHIITLFPSFNIFFPGPTHTLLKSDGCGLRILIFLCDFTLHSD